MLGPDAPGRERNAHLALLRAGRAPSRRSCHAGGAWAPEVGRPVGAAGTGGARGGGGRARGAGRAAARERSGAEQNRLGIQNRTEENRLRE